jgi:Ca2+-binding RTX toxin-like protein
MTTAGTVNAGGVSGVEYYYLANGGADSLTLANANFTGVTGSSITIYGGNDGNTINASALTGANRVIAVGGAGKDVFTGGAGNDYFYFSAANLANTDIVKGGGGTNTLVMTTAGTVDAGGVSGVEDYYLGNGGANSLTLANANFTGVTGSSITIYGGNDGNTINAAALTGANRVIVHAGAGADTLTGGAGNDVFYAGGDTKMTGGLGANEFAFSAAGKNTIADFAASATNEIAFSNAGFALGQSGASATPKALPTSLFTSDATGAFTAATQRFAYDAANGDLYYSASGTTASEHLVATLTNHPTLAASHLFFIT